jgi:hypothetical protein
VLRNLKENEFDLSGDNYGTAEEVAEKVGKADPSEAEASSG